MSLAVYFSARRAILIILVVASATTEDPSRSIVADATRLFASILPCAKAHGYSQSAANAA